MKKSKIFVNFCGREMNLDELMIYEESLRAIEEVLGDGVVEFMRLLRLGGMGLLELVDNWLNFETDLDLEWYLGCVRSKMLVRLNG